jgi:hypothetical protein
MPLRLYPRSRHRSARQSRRPAWWRNAFRIVGASQQRAGDVDGGAVEQADQLGVEPGGAVLAAPQRTSPPRPARSARLATKLNTVSGEISRKELPANSSAENTCDLGRSVQPTRFRAATPLFHVSVNALCTCRTRSSLRQTSCSNTSTRRVSAAGSADRPRRPRACRPLPSAATSMHDGPWAPTERRPTPTPRWAHVSIAMSPSASRPT